MNLNNYLSLAINNFRRQLARSLLTGLGIVIGISAVIIVISAGQGVKGYLVEQLEIWGSNLLQIEIKIPSLTSQTEEAQARGFGATVTTLTLNDMEAIQKHPNIRTSYAGQIGQAVVTGPGTKKTINFLGSSASVVDFDIATVAEGRFFTEEEDASLARVVVLGSKVAEDLFGNTNPVGQFIKIKQRNFKVIGVLKSRGAAIGFDFDTYAYIPIQTMQKQLLGIDYVTFISTQYKDKSKLTSTVGDITYLLRVRHNIPLDEPDKDDFIISSNEDVLAIFDTIVGGLTILLVALATISLIVGGVGIMNIMYVSVLERTFEIGLRKAVGARREQILRQFLVEAVLITGLGGISGIIIGALVSFLISLAAGWLGFAWQFSVPLYSIVLAFGFSAATGLIFGLYPARRAADLDPIEALRYE
ncbi:MAG: ABC transporter permease [Patescibacteria group bacterium]